MSLYGDILDGKHDADIDALFDALREREKVVRKRRALENKASVKVGDKVRITDIRPKYLNGLEATVVQTRGRRADDILVKFGERDFSAQRYMGAEVGVPANCIEVIA